jgi:N-acetylglucosamine kinase-like BadF-type ATPase
MSAHSFGLGIDAGGSRTRWALADASGHVAAEGEAPGMSAMHMGDGQRARDTLARVAAGALAHGRPARVHSGITGFGGEDAILRAMIAAAVGLPPSAVTISSDIEIAYLDLFRPGEGFLVYSGTGSMAAFVDTDGAFHRAGGRGGLLDDGGSGFWIAREALRQIWRLEDERPGHWRDSPMATALFEAIGGSDWKHSREFIHARDRGEIGRLALVVAQAAGEDGMARDILAAAGRELARLALAMERRFGSRPIALAGRASQLHPLIGEAMRGALAPGATLALRESRPHRAAAAIAARAANASPWRP